MNIVYFVADDGVHGSELWRRLPNGTTELVADLNPGAVGSNPGGYSNGLVEFGGALYFSATDPVNGEELRRIGTSGEIELVADIAPGVEASFPGNNGSFSSGLRVFGDALYFTAYDPDSGFELHRVTAAGAVELVGDIYPGQTGSSPGVYGEGLIEADGALYFLAAADTGALTWHRITSAGALETLGAMPSNTYALHVTPFDGTIYFQTTDNTTGSELYRLNATTGAVELAAEIVPGPDSSGPGDFSNGFQVFNGALYFTAYDAANGYELRRIQPGGAVETLDVAPGADSSYPGDTFSGGFTEFNDALYFTAYAPASGYELHRVTSTGAVERVADIHAGSGSAFPGFYSNGLTEFSGALYFTASDETAGFELHRVTSSGTVELVADLAGGGASSSPGNFSGGLFDAGDALYFVATTPALGQALYRVPAATGVVELVGDVSDNATLSGFTVIDGSVYFSASTGNAGQELHRVTPAGTLELVADVNPGAEVYSVAYATAFNGAVYFQGASTSSGTELWRLGADGAITLIDIIAGSGSSNAGQFSNGFTAFGDALYFTAVDATRGYELHRITATGAVELVADIYSFGDSAPGNSSNGLKVFGDALYFTAYDETAGAELHRVTATGTVELVADIYANFSGSFPGQYNGGLIEANGALYFIAYDETTGLTWHRINGAGTLETLGVLPEQSFGTNYVTGFDGTIYFSANTNDTGTELYRLNAATGAVELVADLNPGASWSFLGDGSEGFKVFGGALYFDAYDPTNGYELRRVLTGGTVETIDIAHGSASSDVGRASRGFTEFSGALYFTASDPTNGSELRRITSAGDVELVADINSGSGGAEPGQYSYGLTVFAGALYFSAYEPSTGYELWRVTSSGSVELVADLYAEGNSSSPGNSSGLIEAGGSLWFTAFSETGYNLYRVDDTGAVGTIATDVLPSLRPFADIGGKVYFTDDTSGGIYSVDAAGTFAVVEGAPSFGSNPTHITGLDIGNTAPEVTSLATASVDENTTDVTTATATDYDVPAQALTWSIVGGADAALFEIDAVTGALSFKVAPDFEARGDAGADNVYDVIVQVSDGTLSDTQAISVTLADVNEAPTLAAPIANKVATEDTAFSFVVPLVTVVDPDAGDQVTYSATLANGNALPAWLDFDPATRTFSGTPRNGDVGRIDVRVTGTDTAGESTNDVFRLTVANTNDAPTAIGLAGRSIDEHLPAGTVVGTLTASDVDAGETFTYLLTDDAGGRFAIGAAGNTIVIADPALVNFETGAVQSIEVQVTDSGGATHRMRFDITLGDTTTVILGTVAGETLTGGAFDDTITALGGNETLNGLAGEDDLFGMAGNDRLDGGTGADTMAGGTGDDTYVVDNAGDVVTELAGEGTDTVETTLTDYTLAANVENVVFTTNERVVGRGNSLANTVTGGSGNDTLFGGAGTVVDTLIGGIGNDYLTGGFGNDIMIGGVGNDIYIVLDDDVVTELANEGIDRVETSKTAYTLAGNVENLKFTTNANVVGKGNALANTITGGDGNDTLYGGAGTVADTLIGGVGNDYLTGGLGNDIMTGGVGNDTYVILEDDVVNELADEGTDWIHSNTRDLDLADYANVENARILAGDFDLTGDGATNYLKGGAGDNVLTGRGGQDRLWGEAGADTFKYEAVSDSAFGGTNRDVIYDFVAGQDVIDLSAIDAIVGSPVDDAFTLAGATFSRTAGEVRVYYGASGQYTYVDADQTGDGKADMQIVLVGVHTLQNSDFVF